MPRTPSKTTPFRLQQKERQEKALQMRVDGYSLRAIAEAVGTDASNLCKFFKEYKNESIEALHGELFDMQTERLMELWQNVTEDMRKFVPVLDAKGEALTVPVLGRDGQPVLDADGSPKTEYMRDFGVHLNAVNVAAKVTERIARHFGTDAATKMATTFENVGNGVVQDFEFRIVDCRESHPEILSLDDDEMARVLAFIRDNKLGQQPKLIEGSKA